MSILDGKPGSMLLPQPSADTQVMAELQARCTAMQGMIVDAEMKLRAEQTRCADVERQLSEERQRTAAVQATVDLASQRAATAESAAVVERQRADDAITRAQSAVNPDAALRVQLDAEIAGRARAEGELAAIKAQMAAESEDDAAESENEDEKPPTYKVLVTKRDGNDRIVEITMRPEA